MDRQVREEKDHQGGQQAGLQGRRQAEHTRFTWPTAVLSKYSGRAQEMDCFTLILLGSSRLSQEHVKHSAVTHAERGRCSMLATEALKPRHPRAGKGASAFC